MIPPTGTVVNVVQHMHNRSMGDVTWYERFGAVPGLNYSTPPGIRRPPLPAGFLKPQRNVFQIDGKPVEQLSWPMENGSTSASPAQRWSVDTDPRDPPPDLLLKRLFEKLELPGLAKDYHFVLLHAYELLVRHARRDPDLWTDLERVCLLDISLIERQPHVLRIFDDREELISVPAYRHLISLYERNGLLDDALAVAQRAAAVGYGKQEVDRLQERIDALGSEDA